MAAAMASQHCAATCCIRCMPSIFPVMMRCCWLSSHRAVGIQYAMIRCFGRPWHVVVFCCMVVFSCKAEVEASKQHFELPKGQRTSLCTPSTLVMPGFVCGVVLQQIVCHTSWRAAKL